MSRSSAAHPAETLSSARVHLCGPLTLEAGGREIALRGRQARLIVAFLTWNRQRAIGRDELIELLWPRDAPAEPDEVLSALLSKLRRALGPGALEGRRELTLAFGADAWIDVETARGELDRAEAAFERHAWLGHSSSISSSRATARRRFQVRKATISRGWRPRSSISRPPAWRLSGPHRRTRADDRVSAG